MPTPDPVRGTVNENVPGGQPVGDKVWNVLLVGVGGQGVVLASDILAAAALEAGWDVKKSEIHGMSQRGGSVFSHVRFGPIVHSPTIPRGEVDVLASLERIEALRWSGWAHPGAAVCYVDHEIHPQGVRAYNPGVDDEIARLFGTTIRFEDHALKSRISAKVKNTALLGAISLLVPIPQQAFLAALAGHVPARTEEANATAFAIGREIGSSALAEATEMAEMAGRPAPEQEPTHVE
ncbi:indolepyruvate ferredoxin oxidoreductase beta subunit [Raineyella antarctica]|uniref:Indolepyruvate ferredoxin oxidoreductase beta subunit n=1 Tax=Raineyella antarctica TaxID=1577474 RepID=A0A1G6HIH4_9ACTN|nr:2-oxoacid:acceptor oxidoreductase family protein [Raineyella antarctica]SDB93246.1 indolepyruvate ferredoxin oxidoreductase beta subunit [Raineyella antarctica]